MHIENVMYLPSGRIFLIRTNDNYLIEATEMRDVSVGGKEHFEVRESQDPKVIWKHLRPFSEKWLLTVSTQKGCVHNCKFCDVAPLPFKGNLSACEIDQQIQLILQASPYVSECSKVKIGFARMGEPAHNLLAVLRSIKTLPTISNRRFNWLPCFNSILPRKTTQNFTGIDVITDVIKIKEENYNGFLHFQVSCNSTDEKVRNQLFGGAEVLSIPEIISEVNTLEITNRTVTLNFIVMQDIPIDIEYLMRLGLNPEKFTVKLIPLNQTNNAGLNKLHTYANYSSYEKLQELTDKFQSYGIPVVMDAIAKCEEGGLCCGQLAQFYADNS